VGSLSKEGDWDLVLKKERVGNVLKSLLSKEERGLAFCVVSGLNEMAVCLSETECLWMIN
jgi:hypothetical protein